MQKNIGIFDRITRIAGAIMVGLLYLGGQISGATALVFGVVAVVFLITGFAGGCPLYGACNFSSQKNTSTKEGI